MTSPNVNQYDAAREAGLSVASSVRWVRYLAMKAARGERPITLAEAVEQKRRALAGAR